MNLSLSNALFISDLHLMEDRPDCIRAFFRFLEWLPESIDALFILGDFFEFWVGDDVELHQSGKIAQALKRASVEKGVKIYFLPGNRDFSLGHDYCDKAGMVLLEDDEVLVTIANQQVLLSHGDLYCTDDRSYQRYRKVIRHPWTLSLLRSLNQKLRIRIASSLRAKSKQNYQQHKTLIDVTLQTIERALHHYKADVLVHGHTHLADIHLHRGTDTLSKEHYRMVLGDWHVDGWYGYIDQQGPRLHRFSVSSPEF